MPDNLTSLDTLWVMLILLGLSLAGAWFLLRFRRGDSAPKKSRINGLLVLLAVLLALSLFSISLFLRAYHSFTREQLVAVVSFEESEFSRADFVLVYRPVVRGEIGRSVHYPIRGDQWTIGGDVIKWSSALNLIGLHTMYRLTRIEGRFLDPEDRRASIYSLSRSEDSAVWRALHSLAHKLPLISAVYGNAVYTYPSMNERFEIYVTTSGFIARKRGLKDPIPRSP